MKTKIEIKSVFGKLLFEYESENNTIAKTVNEAIKRSADLRYANLRYADLSSANLRSANLRSANLSSADLSYADLRYADLRYADLSSADLRSADLCYAKTDKRYIQVGCIGSAKRMTTYCFEDDIVVCGCFKGSLEEFEKQVKRTHDKNEIYLKEYLGFITYVQSLK